MGGSEPPSIPTGAAGSGISGAGIAGATGFGTAGATLFGFGTAGATLFGFGAAGAALLGFAAFALTTFFTGGAAFATFLATFFATFFALRAVLAGPAFFIALLFVPARFAFPTGRFFALLFFFAMIFTLLAV